MENHLTFINIINDKTNIDEVVIDIQSDQEAENDLTIDLGTVQKKEHVMAGVVGTSIKPQASAPRDMATSFQFLHQAVSLKIRISECPNLHQHGNFCTDL